MLVSNGQNELQLVCSEKFKQDATQERLGQKRCQLQFGIMIFVNLELGHDLDLQIILIQVDPMIT